MLGFFRVGRWIKTGRRALLVLGSVVFALAMLEVVLRVADVRPGTATLLTRYFQYDPDCGWRGAPNVSRNFFGADFDVLTSHDSDGLRVSGLDVPLSDDRTFDGEVVWCLGDSQTWGWGVADGNTYIDRLNELSKGRRRFRNFGTPHTGTLQQFLQLRKYIALGHKPHRAIVLYTCNDLDDNLSASDRGRPYYEIVNGDAILHNHPAARPGWSFKSWLRQNLRTYNFFYEAILRRRIAGHQRRRLEARQSGAKMNEYGKIQNVELDGPDWERRKIGQHAAYSALLEICNEQGIQLAIAVAYKDDLAEVERCVAGFDIPILDLSVELERYQNSPDAEPVVFKTDPHFTNPAHRVMGDAIYTELKRMPPLPH